MSHGFILAMYRNGVRFLVEVEKHGNGVWFPLLKIIRMILSQEGYSGRSKQGIAIGSEEADVRAQYGFPSRILSMPQWTSWIYEGEGIVFQLREAKVVSWQLF